MKTTSILLSFVILLTAGCDRAPQPGETKPKDSLEEKGPEDQRLADERRANELRELEKRAAEREAAARNAETDLERKKIAEERASLEEEKRRLMAEQRRSDEKRAAEQNGREQAREEQKIEFFHDALEPYGEWVELDQYGFCWLPRAAADRRWRPYTAGNWAWTEYGWTWASIEPFGWATYHYGRWTRIKKLGWVWVPGSEWAPAWVAWRRNENFVGWAPLPPDAHSGSGFTAAVDSYYDIGPQTYAFVTVQDFGEATYVGRVVEPDQNITIINNTVNVTNITYRNVENKTVIFNAGPEIDVINQRSNQKVRRLNVERVADPKSVGPAERKGDVLRLAAPEIKSAPRATAPPTKIKPREKGQEIDRGWPEGDAEDGKKIRRQAAEEARKAEREQRAGKDADKKDADKSGAPNAPETKQQPENKPQGKPAPVLPKPALPTQEPGDQEKPENAPVTPPVSDPAPVAEPKIPKLPPPDVDTAPAKKTPPSNREDGKGQSKAKPNEAKSPAPQPPSVSPATPPAEPRPTAVPSGVLPPLVPGIVAPPVITPPVVAPVEKPSTPKEIRDAKKNQRNEKKTEKGKEKSNPTPAPTLTDAASPEQPSAVPAPIPTPPLTSPATPSPDAPVAPVTEEEEAKRKREKRNR